AVERARTLLRERDAGHLVRGERRVIAVVRQTDVRLFDALALHALLGAARIVAGANAVRVAGRVSHRCIRARQGAAFLQLVEVQDEGAGRGCGTDGDGGEQEGAAHRQNLHTASAAPPLGPPPTRTSKRRALAALGGCSPESAVNHRIAPTLAPAIATPVRIVLVSA